MTERTMRRGSWLSPSRAARSTPEGSVDWKPYEGMQFSPFTPQPHDGSMRSRGAQARPVEMELVRSWAS
jgi:hypothetical protein